jgi:serine/threonine-protein kinase
VLVPSLTGSTCAQAQATLLTDNLKGLCAAGRYDPTTPAGQLLFWTFGSQTDPTKAPYGSTLALVPSLGHAPVPVPSNITNSDTFGEAQAALQAVGLTATQASSTSTTVPSGQVVSITPAAGTTVPYGSAVTVTISTGPPTTTVPDVYQDTVAQATTALQGANLTVAGAYGPHAGQPGAQVIYTQPAQGATEPQGTPISLYTN